MGENGFRRAGGRLSTRRGATVALAAASHRPSDSSRGDGTRAMKARKNPAGSRLTWALAIAGSVSTRGGSNSAAVRNGTDSARTQRKVGFGC